MGRGARLPWAASVVVLTAALAPTACGRTTTPAPTAAASSSSSAASSSSVVVAASSAPASSSAPTAASTSPPDPLARVSYRDLVAAGAWEAAARAVAGLSEPERAGAPARLALARIAIGRCTKDEGARAVTLLDGLTGTPDLPAEVVARLRVDALVCAERWSDALAVDGAGALVHRKGAAAAAARARVLEQAGELSAARLAYGDAIAGARSAGLPQGALLSARLRVLRKLATNADVEAAIASDRARLFIEFPLAFDAAAKAGESPTAPPMTANDWVRRAEALAALGKGEEAQHALDAAASAGLPKPKLARARAHAHWKARSWSKAAVALREASALEGGDDAVEDEFLAARAQSRGGDDDGAIVAYEALAKKHPKAKWAGEAAYLAAHLRWLRGQWPDAIAAFDRYLAGPWAKAKPQANNVREARRARAFALLESNKLVAARQALHALAKGDGLADEPFARGRIELLAAVAAERAGDRGAALATYAKLSSDHPYGWLDLASRARRAHLGEAVGTWPLGPVDAPPLPALSPEVRLLTHAGLSTDALERFVKAGLPKDDAPRCAALTAFDDGWNAYRLGLKLSVNQAPDPSTAWKWRCAWPAPYESVVAALEARDGLPRGLLHAILRQESAFRVDVVSPAGAVGIAQLMPQTAVTTAAAQGVTLDPTDIAGLQQPFLQLDLASRHLRALFVELCGEGATDVARREAVPLIIGAYNAGAGAVKRWMKEAGGMDADVFVERTPFLETRGYVARVMGNLIRYAVITGSPTPVLPRKLPSPP